MIKLKALLTEIVSNPIIELGKYLQSTSEQKGIELAYDIFSEKIFDWIDENYPQLSKQIHKFEADSPDAVAWLEQNDPQIFKQFVLYIYKEAERVDLYDFTMAGHPTWNYMEFQGYVKNQWLIHFSDSAGEIWADQRFKYGMDDYTTLGLTTYYRQARKQTGGYNFAYDIGDFIKYGRSSYQSRSWKYGREAVMFRASGVKVWHYGDQEPQVIFWGATARDIVHLQNTDESDWGVINHRTMEYIYREDLPQVVRWVIQNFDQYKKVLLS